MRSGLLREDAHLRKKYPFAGMGFCEQELAVSERKGPAYSTQFISTRKRAKPTSIVSVMHTSIPFQSIKHPKERLRSGRFLLTVSSDAGELVQRPLVKKQNTDISG